MTHFKKYWLAYLIIGSLLFVSCASSKTKRNTETKTEVKEEGTILNTRKADTMSYTILNPIYKDTTITVTNKENRSTLYVKYNDKGEQNISYTCDEIQELINYKRNTEEQKKETVKEKESIFKEIYILYLFLGFAFLILFTKVLAKFGI